MKVVWLTRMRSDEEGTFGVLAGDNFGLVTAEPPWRNNRRGVSCIPAGTYRCEWRKSNRFGWTYEVLDVPGRDHILFHAGNWAGDVRAGYLTDTNGCILVGMRIGTLTWRKPDGTYVHQSAVIGSRVALKKLFVALDQQPFTLHIEWWTDAVRV